MGMREAYLEKMDAQLKEWSARMDVLKAKAEKASADVKLQYQRQLEEWKARQSAARAKLDELKASSGERWEDVKTGLEKAWSELKTTFEKTPPTS